MINLFKKLIGGSSGPQVEDHGTFPELVFLMKRPLSPTAEFLQGAIEHSLGKKLPTDAEGDATEFIKGEAPILMFQIDGHLIQAKFAPVDYFSEDSLPFLNADPEMIKSKLAGTELERRVKKHKGWIAASLMALDGKPVECDGVVNIEHYRMIGKFLTAFGEDEIPAAIWPGGGRITAWSSSKSMFLSGSNPLAIFGVSS